MRSHYNTTNEHCDTVNDCSIRVFRVQSSVIFFNNLLGSKLYRCTQVSKQYTKIKKLHKSILIDKRKRSYLLLALILIQYYLCCYGTEISIPGVLSLKTVNVTVELYLPATNITVSNLDK